MFDQANCEDKFQTVNMVNGTYMDVPDAPGSELMPEQKRAGIQNARDIERQILRLIRIFSRKEMRDKLQKEFGFLFKTANEIDMFNEQFRQLKKLWTTKLCTPLEEVNSVLELKQKLVNSTTSLKD
jgi:hypothetical protein